MIEHIVLLKLKPYTTDQQLQGLTDALVGMKEQISGIVDITAGINNSPEGKSHGFSYGFIVRFVDQVARDNICHIQSILRSPRSHFVHW